MSQLRKRKRNLIEVLEIIAVIALFIACVMLITFLIIVLAYVHDFAAEFYEIMKAH